MTRAAPAGTINDKEREHPLEPDVEVSENSSDAVELASDVEWSKDPLNWSAGNEVTGTLYLGCTGAWAGTVWSFV